MMAAVFTGLMVAVRPSKGPSRFRPIVTSEDDDRIVADVEFVDCVQDLSDMRIHFSEAVGKVSVPCFARELRIRQRREMNQRERNIRVERLAGGHAPFHEIDRPPGTLRVDEPALVEIIHGKFAATPAALAAGSEGQNASSVVRGIPYHSSKP